METYRKQILTFVRGLDLHVQILILCSNGMRIWSPIIVVVVEGCWLERQELVTTMHRHTNFEIGRTLELDDVLCRGLNLLPL